MPITLQEAEITRCRDRADPGTMTLDGAREGATVSLWEQHRMEERVRRVLEDVHLNNPQGHHFGRPYLSSYQIAIALDAEDPGLKHGLGKPVGGSGTGAHNSLAQYIGGELSRQIKVQGELHYAEGAFLSNERVQAIAYRGADGSQVLSSLVGTDFDMALFRMRSR